MPDFRIKNADGSYSSPSNVKIRTNGSWASVSSVKTVASHQWIEVYPTSSRPTNPSSSYVLVSEDQLQTQKKRIGNGVEPIATAYDRLLIDADDALKMNLRSVTNNDGDHDFADEESDKDAAELMSTAARDCGLAYWFTGDDTYADRCVDIIHHFCLDSDTYMTPSMDQEKKHLTIGSNIMHPGLWYGASFVRDHPRWKDYSGDTPWKSGSAAGAEAAFHEWVRDRLETFDETVTDHTNNIWAWRIADYAASAAYLQDDAAMRLAKDMWRGEAYTQLSDGREKPRPWPDFKNVSSTEAYFTQERNRSSGFHYTQFNLDALTTALHVFEAYDGTDLWGFNAPTDNHSGSSIEKAFNWLAPYVGNPGSWDWDADGHVESGAVADAAAVFEGAHRAVGGFGDVVDHGGGRPHRLRFIQGPITLTHGRP